MRVFEFDRPSWGEVFVFGDVERPVLPVLVHTNGVPGVPFNSGVRDSDEQTLIFARPVDGNDWQSETQLDGEESEWRPSDFAIVQGKPHVLTDNGFLLVLLDGQWEHVDADLATPGSPRGRLIEWNNEPATLSVGNREIVLFSHRVEEIWKRDAAHVTDFETLTSLEMDTLAGIPRAYFYSSSFLDGAIVYGRR
jgi:hypothetical protein